MTTNRATMTTTTPNDYETHHDLCKAACERKPGEGPVEKISALVQGLMQRHAGDDATLVALMAIDEYHLADVEELLQEVA